MSLQILHSSLDKNLEKKVNDFVHEWEDSNNHIIAKTSGSTGAPREILLSKDVMRHSAQLTGHYFDFSSSSVLLCCLNPDFIAGKMMLVRALTFGCQVILTQPEHPLNYPDSLTVDFTAMVPLQLEKALAQHPHKLNQISHIIVGGAAVSSPLEKQLNDLNCRVFETYGMTETTSHVALRPLGGELKKPFEALGEITFSTHSDDCLTIHAEALGHANLHTTDIVKWVDHRHFYWLGRADFVINSGGIKLHPEQLEQKLANANLPFRYFITAIPDERLGQAVCLVVESDCTPIIDFGSFLEKYELPKRIAVIAPFSETASGKINRPETLRRLD